MKIRKNKKGFTLVELVVVIAILAILAGTATVATIAILNNSRKTPVTDAAGNLKSQIQQYTLMDDYTADRAGFAKFLTGAMPDLVLETECNANITEPSDDKIHVKLEKGTNLRTQDFVIVVYTKYFKQKITYKYDATQKGFTTFELSDVKKTSERF